MLLQGKINQIIEFISIMEVFGICFIIGMAFALQLLWNDLPCPLCLLQRLGLLGIALGFLLNIRYHVRPSHYAISLLSALFTAFVALRQIALHISDSNDVFNCNRLQTKFSETAGDLNSLSLGH